MTEPALAQRATNPVIILMSILMLATLLTLRAGSGTFGR